MDSEFTQSSEETIRRSPLASVGLAALGALVLSKLPVGAVIGALLRLAFALVRPALLIFGIIKVVEWARQAQAAAPITEDGPGISEAVS